MKVGPALDPDEVTAAPPQDGDDAYERHAAVAILCSELAHEIAPALAFLREMARSRDLSEDDRSIAEEEVARLASVMAALRSAKRAPESLAPIEIARVAAAAVARVQREMRGRANLEVDVPAGIRVLASARMVELALVSLLRNALAGAGAGASVGAGAGGRRGAGRVWLRARRDGDRWILEVEDDGPGFPEALGAKLFEPLATLGAGGRGTGITVALRAAREHGWEFDQARRDGRTVMSMRFRADDPSSHATEAP